MARYGVAQAKNTLPRLIDKAVAGEEVVITRHGKAVAELRSTAQRKGGSPSATYDWLRAGRDALPPIAITSVELFDAMYEEDDD